MASNTTSFLALSLISMCGTPQSSQDEPTATGFSCSDYQIMLDVELKVGQECVVDSDCQQVLTGTGCGCESDDIIEVISFFSGSCPAMSICSIMVIYLFYCN